MRVKPDRRRGRRVLAAWWFPAAVSAIYAATIALSLPAAVAAPWLEPSYLGALALLALATVARAALFAAGSSFDLPTLLVASLILHGFVVMRLVPPGADLPLHVGVVAIAAFALSFARAGMLAVLLALVHTSVAPRPLEAGPVALAVVPLVIAWITVGAMSARERRARESALGELRRQRALADQIDASEGSLRMGEDHVLGRRNLVQEQLDRDLGNVVSLARRTMGGAGAALFDVDRQHDVLRPRYAEREGSFDMECAIPVGKGPIGWVALKGEPFRTPDLRSEPTDPGYCGKPPYPRCVLAAPVKQSDVVTGVLVLDSLEAGAFGSGDAGHLQDFARWIAALYEGTGMMRQWEENARRFEALHDASGRLSQKLELGELCQQLLGIARDIAGYDRAYVIDRLEGGGIQVLAGDGAGALPAGESIRAADRSWGSQLMLQGHAFLLSDLSGEGRPMPLLSEREERAPGGPWKSILGIPILRDKECVRGLLLATTTRAYLAREQSVMEILANQAGHAIENARLYKRMEEMATTDGLTGLYNHRYFQEELDRSIERHERSGTKLGLALLDIDHFKKMNDTYGHPAGDQVLKTLAGVLRSTARRTDVVARYGGEEFVVVLPDTDGGKAGEMATRIRNAVRETVFRADGKTIKVTISLGIACYPEDAKQKSELIDCADKALYYSKESGRDQWNAYGKVKGKIVDRKKAAP
ncbi:MAG: diguanylate cyclase [Acidobacteriota bacterium]